MNRDTRPRNWDVAWAELAKHPLFRGLTSRVRLLPQPARCEVTWQERTILFHQDTSVTVTQWRHHFAHALAHAGMGHTASDMADNVALCRSVNQLLTALRISAATPHDNVNLPSDPGAAAAVLRDNPKRLAEIAHHCPGEKRDLGARLPQRHDLAEIFGQGLQDAVEAAVDVAAGRRVDISSAGGGRKTPWQMAWNWTLTSFPLLGAVAAGMSIVEDPDTCRALDIAVAAVDADAGILYFNPFVSLRTDERRFVVAHEMLHAALLHHKRIGDRDRWLWNVACDYAINSWLVSMNVGALPPGALYDVHTAELSSEQIYDTIVGDLRKYRKLATLRGVGLGDILGPTDRAPGSALGLDDFYRNAIYTGLDLWRAANRGLTPAGLEQEVRAIHCAPIDWDVQLAAWFDEHFPSTQAHRSYSRLSRRQAAAPSVVMAGRVWPEELRRTRTFALVLDTSGSISQKLMAHILGTVCAYAVERHVARVRLVCCDAAAYDLGYVDVDAVAARVTVKGRGGTVLAPAVALLEHAADFPDDGPILIATDGQCDHIQPRRSHAYLLPKGGRLPFNTSAPIFHVEPPRT